MFTLAPALFVWCSRWTLCCNPDSVPISKWRKQCNVVTSTVLRTSGLMVGTRHTIYCGNMSVTKVVNVWWGLFDTVPTVTSHKETVTQEMHVQNVNTISSTYYWWMTCSHAASTPFLFSKRMKHVVSANHVNEWQLFVKFVVAKWKLKSCINQWLLCKNSLPRNAHTIVVFTMNVKTWSAISITHRKQAFSE